MPAAIDKDESIQKEGKRIELVKDSPKQFAASGAAAVSAPANPDKRADVSTLHAERAVAQAQEASVSSFNKEEVLHDLSHYLPSQAPLKDFIHHNTLHAFQNYPFYEGALRAKKIFGFFPSLQLREYRDLYEAERVRKDILERVISERKGSEHLDEWMEKVLHKEYDDSVSPRIGKLRANWKRHYPIDLD
ncbi:MAG TPA: putative inorganic carbon transporter subunit DabA, partial [Nitrosospira sp.]|nr:putative inorganic carbon transporter subunit DabA [Nitrosospira sp.]